ncbi:hypothetical protein DdX_03814 [Ditylenchus destructor]|uniref:Uncharacterized protein n=1 Tax=Ditylenchus destructor TaxID=166010 RepID=A0AAD4NAR9_9BILA|nr:hypothetical protein DdX_03814 [Ditylenchus destructor]
MIFPVDSGDNTVFGNTHCCGVKQDISRYANFCRMILCKAIILLMIVGLAFGEISGRIKRSYYYNYGYANDASCCGPPPQLMSSKRTVTNTQQQGGLLGAILGAPVTSVSDSFPA